MEPDAVEADEYLENLPYTVVENIINGLSNDKAWEKVAQYLKTTTKISDECLRSLRCNTSPERKLFDVLVNRCRVTVNLLQKILENCQLYDILRFINTNDPAEILHPKEDESFNVPFGTVVELPPVYVRGSPFPLIEWYRNGRLLVGKTSPQLVLENFSFEDVGEYTCKIKQRLNGSVSEQTSSKYILNIEDTAPRISGDGDLKDVKIKAYEDLSLSFVVTGYPEPEYFKWFKDNNLKSTTTRPQLKIQKADVHDSGQYCCQASSRAGSCFTRPALVKIEGPVICPENPEIIEQPSTSPEYYVGDWLYLICRVLCRQPVKFTCFLNDKGIEGNSNAQMSPSSSSYQHWCTLQYCLTKEQMDKEKLKQLKFKFHITSANGNIQSDDVKVEVKTRNVKKTHFARNKWALLIGNSHYQKMDGLPASKNDIQIIAKKFTELQFRVLVLSDLTRSALQSAVKHFCTFIQKGDYVAFYYAGHGIHDNGKDYIIPTDANIKYISRKQNVCHDKKDISLDDCISYVWVINNFQRDEPALIYSVYDTCRQMKPKFEGCQSSSPEYQTALKNSFSIFATSQNYEAYEKEKEDTSLLVDTLQSLMISPMSVQELSLTVLEKFDFPGKWEERQVPRVDGDLVLPLSLADPSRPHENDGPVLEKWDELGGVGGIMQDFIPMENTTIEAAISWNAEPHKDGVRWVISNCLPLTLNLSQDANSEIQEIVVQIKLWNGIMDSQKLRGSLSWKFSVCHLQDLQKQVWIELCCTCKGYQKKKTILLGSPAISQKFFKGNNMD